VYENTTKFNATPLKSKPLFCFGCVTSESLYVPCPIENPCLALSIRTTCTCNYIMYMYM